MIGCNTLLVRTCFTVAGIVTVLLYRDRLALSSVQKALGFLTRGYRIPFWEVCVKGGSTASGAV